MTSQKTISLEDELWTKIDHNRGDISRSRFIAKILADSLEISYKQESQRKGGSH